MVADAHGEGGGGTSSQTGVHVPLQHETQNVMWGWRMLGRHSRRTRSPLPSVRHRSHGRINLRCVAQ
ncbi:hypothetical protein EON67_09950 [archaeon]|nr:MAG: hypothetical protein EON67_09950 [archaeon]